MTMKLRITLYQAICFQLPAIGVIKNKSQLAEICEILDTNTSILRYPLDLFKPDSLSGTSIRPFKCAKPILRALKKGMCDLISPSNSNFIHPIIDKAMVIEAP